MVFNPESFTKPEMLPPPPAWMLAEVELLENIDNKIEEDNKKRVKYYKDKPQTNNKKFKDLKINYPYAMVWSDYEPRPIIYNGWEPRKRIHKIMTLKIIKLTKCYITFSINGSHPWRKKINDYGNGEFVIMDHFHLDSSELYDPKQDEERAATIIQRGFRFHRWDINGKFIWKVEERHMNDDGFFWDEDGNMLKPQQNI